MNAFRDWLQGEVEGQGWTALCSRGEFTTGALQGWLRGAFPSPKYQVKIAKATGISIDKLRLLVWESERLAQEVEPASASFRPGPQTRGGSGSAAASRPAGRRSVPRVVAPPRVVSSRPRTRPDSTSSVKWWSDQRAA